jgi:hypothetical protein
MRKISFWRYLAVNLKTLFTALACALLVFGMLGCGQTNQLKSITLQASLVNGVAPTGQSGFITLQGNGGTIQLQAIGNYSNSKTSDLTNRVTYTVIVDANHNVDAFGNALLPPCQAPSCPAPSAPPYTNGTVEYDGTGLITAVEPATCTFIDDQGADVYVGAYEVTVSFQGITSQPVYIPVASSAGPSGACPSGS